MSTTYLADSIPTEFAQGALARYGYREYGIEGDIPVVLLQRFRGTIDDWDPKLLDLIAETRRVIIFDNVGVGATDGTAPGTIAEMANGVLDFLSARGLSQVDLLGWSMGGFIAQFLAVTHPESFRRIVAAGTGPGEPSVRPEESERSRQIREKTEPDLDDVLYLFFPDTEDGRNRGLNAFSRLGHHNSGTVLTVKTESWQNQAAAIGKWNQGEGSAWDRLPALTTPLLVVAGVADVMEPAEQAFATAQRAGGDTTIAIFADGGHAFPFEYPERFSSLISSFLEPRSR